MRRRTQGKSTNKPELYRGIEIMDKETFYAFGLGSLEFHRLFTQWTESRWKRWLVPSVDRIDGSKGYVLGNVQWLTLSDNCAKAGRNCPQSEDSYEESNAI